ncbi:MAG: hypothetical protein IKV98_07430 [Clostridia bacterium]|nr:hypothetical protein [Clostridia bacterium]
MRSGAKKHITAAIAFILVGITLVCGTAIATGARRTETIDATYDNIKIVVDGLTIDPKDANGNKVEPFIYNGTTYLPVRAVGEAFGKQVSWDGVEKIVYLGPKPGEIQNWFSQCMPYQYGESAKVFTYENNNSFNMSGKKYTDSFALARDDFASFNLDGKYNSVTFIAGHIDGQTNWDATLKVFVDEKLVLTEVLKHDGLAKKFEIPLNGALHMKIVLESKVYNCFYGFADGHFE